MSNDNTEENMDEFFLWYQEPLASLGGEEVDSLISLFTGNSPLKSRNWYDNRKIYPREWCQSSLDFLYRTVVSGLCDFTFLAETLHPVIDILAEQGPDIGYYYGTWETYQIYLTDKGVALLRECHVDVNKKETSLLLKEKLTKLFYDCGVGFEKSAFVKMNDYPPESE